VECTQVNQKKKREICLSRKKFPKKDYVRRGEKNLSKHGCREQLKEEKREKKKIGPAKLHGALRVRRGDGSKATQEGEKGEGADPGTNEELGHQNR